MSNLEIFTEAILDELEKQAMMAIQKNPNSIMGGNKPITAPPAPKPMPHLPSATAPKKAASQVIGTNVAEKRVKLPTNVVGGK